MAENKKSNPEEQKKPKWYDEDWVSVQPDPEKISCRDCYFREKDRKIGPTVIYGSTLGICEVYDCKPDAILFKGVKCPYYVSDSDDE